MAEIIEFSKDNLTYIAKRLKEGALAAFPTDTVYGMGGILESDETIRRFYSVKRRSVGKPSQVMVSNTLMLKRYVRHPGFGADKVLDKFFPGSLTAVLDASMSVPPSVTVDGSVGIRMPNHPLLLELIDLVSSALIVGSANFESAKTPSSFEHIDPQLLALLDLILVGPVLTNKASTVVDLRVDPPKLIREGPISILEIQRAFE
jgi:L-threonylcarbamoyladenylate synthase